ncbi:MAG: lysophospholipid acyltransferase family protein [Bacteroidota bacterium]
MSSVLIAFPFFALISIGNNIAARKAIWKIIHLWSRGWLWIIGMPIKIQGTPPSKEHHIIVANHISYLDALVLFPSIPFYFRALGKKEFAKIPVIGFIYRQLVVLVDRSSQHSRAKSMKLMWRVLKHESSIAIFPEGTFNETPDLLKNFYDGAFRLAINTGVPIVPLIFPDTVLRWHYSHWWKLSPGLNRAIYLPPIPAAGLTLQDLPALKEKVYQAMEQELQKYGYPYQPTN